MDDETKRIILESSGIGAGTIGTVAGYSKLRGLKADRITERYNAYKVGKLSRNAEALENIISYRDDNKKWVNTAEELFNGRIIEADRKFESSKFAKNLNRIMDQDLPEPPKGLLDPRGPHQNMIDSADIYRKSTNGYYNALHKGVDEAKSSLQKSVDLVNAKKLRNEAAKNFNPDISNFMSRRTRKVGGILGGVGLSAIAINAIRNRLKKRD